MSTFTYYQTPGLVLPWQGTVDLSTPLGLTNIRGFGAVQAYACTGDTYLLLRLQSGAVTDIVHSSSMTISDTASWIASTLAPSGVSNGGPWVPLVDLTDAMARTVAVSADGVAVLMRGDDRFVGSAADESFQGGGGVNTVDFGAATQAVQADLALGLATGQGADHLQGIQNLMGRPASRTPSRAATPRTCCRGVLATTPSPGRAGMTRSRVASARTCLPGGPGWTSSATPRRRKAGTGSASTAAPTTASRSRRAVVLRLRAGGGHEPCRHRPLRRQQDRCCEGPGRAVRLQHDHQDAVVGR